MDTHYLYLYLNLGSLAIPLLFSFYKKAPFYKTWKTLFISTAIPAVVFLTWDEIFTVQGIWGFNPDFLMGIYIFHLPLEEVLFFFCIPYACIFTYYALNYLIHTDYLAKVQPFITLSLSLLLLCTGIYHLDKLYTAVTFISLGLFLSGLEYFTKSQYLSRFYLSYAIILIPFFIVNGALTGAFTEEPVVWYNNYENLSIRIGTIPIEDPFYGMLLLVMNVSIFEYLRSDPFSKSH